MEERRYDGEVVLTSQVTKEDLERAMADRANRTVAVHREGSVVADHKGRFYRCNAAGQWVRLREAPHA